MIDPSFKAAFERTDKEVIHLAEQDTFMRMALEGLRRTGRMSFYSSVSPVWMMEHGERAALSMLVNLIKPTTIIEIGTRFGGSAFLFAETAKRVICIDIDEAVRSRTIDVANIEIIIGNSVDEIPRVLSDLRAKGEDFDLALIDGDHSAEGVKADIEAFLATRPTKPCWLILHDTFNPEVRRGIRSVNWDKPWVSQVEIDFVPGYIKQDPPIRLQLWGGIGVVELQPIDRSEPLIVNEEGRILYEVAHKFSSDATKRVNLFQRVVRKVASKIV